MAIPLTTFLLIRDLKDAIDEDEKKAIRIRLIDARHKANSTEEREAIETALLNDSIPKE